ncbi:DUF1902 domain-containing protein [Sphingorhabdus contaminans]|uniref:DUF1902 domain-containing protein n=1 Tax=Sphingorhabdus contaminans TaxID=1343899 RepID=UPI003D2B48DF
MKHISTFSVQVRAELDDEAGVWVATTDDVPGLVAEHEDLKQLFEMVTDLLPILIVENNMMPNLQEAHDVPVHIAAHALAKRNVLIEA